MGGGGVAGNGTATVDGGRQSRGEDGTAHVGEKADIVYQSRVSEKRLCEKLLASWAEALEGEIAIRAWGRSREND